MIDFSSFPISDGWPKACFPFKIVEISDILEWLLPIEFTEWPQQPRTVLDQLRPAMINDPSWYNFKNKTDRLVNNIMEHFQGCRDYNRMLSVVMPNASILPHCDDQPINWVIRVHVPLQTNKDVLFVVNGENIHMPVGSAYIIDTKAEHAVYNNGNIPRIHFMFDISK